MRPLVGWNLGGATLTPRDVSPRPSSVGEPIWGPPGLLRDLELRLGLPPVTAAMSLRVPAWRANIARLADQNAFYAASFNVDPVGTAMTLLAWRDALVEAGWDGEPIPNGGHRVDALAAIETLTRSGGPKGEADRLVRLEQALGTHHTRIYESVTLVEDRTLWSGRWQRIFRTLEEGGTTFDRLPVDFGLAAPTTDLGRVQRALRASSGGPLESSALAGDGSVLLLRGDTPAELAELVASILRQDEQAADAVVVRALDASPLEVAFERHGLASQGHRIASACRPAMQVLPLALELAFEPRDPYRVLELLTLPLGPFRGLLGNLLARAVSSQPGVGGQKWTRLRTRAADLLRDRHARRMREEGKSDEDADALADANVTTRMARVAEWIEAPGASVEGAPREHLLAVAERIRAWLQARLGTDEAELYGAAYAQATSFVEAVLHETRETLSLEETRELSDRLARSAHGHDLAVEEAGRIPHVSHPGALLAPRRMVIVWGFVTNRERWGRPPWNCDEQNALADAGVAFPEPAKLLAIEADAWRRTVLAATERVLLVAPSSVKGEPIAPHPLWDEIRARLGLDDVGAARLTRNARSLVEEGGAEGLVRVERLSVLRLPEGHGTWDVAPEILLDETEERGASATSLEKLASCPLAWVLEQRAKLRSGAITKVARGPLLNGNLSHRLVEELHRENAFALDESQFCTRVDARFDELVATEGATLLLPGASSERAQLARQIHRALRDFHRYLTANGYTIASVEEQLETDSAIGILHGRLDVRLVDRDGRSSVVDLKWGASSYEKRLKEGRAVQLAAYARAVSANEPKTGEAARLPAAAYFALAKGKVVTVDERMHVRRLAGPTLDETWRRVEATAKTVLASYATGKIYVSGTKRALPLLEALGVPEAERDAHFKTGPDVPCEYCSYDKICGRAWSEIA